MPVKASSTEAKKWEGMLRGSLLSGTMSKMVSYVGFADSRAQGIIVLNAVLIPVALGVGQNPNFRLGALISIIAAILSMSTAVVSLYPKSYSPRKDAESQLLHFSAIQKMSKVNYLQLMQERLANADQLTQLAAGDIYYLSRYILAPKFFWLKLSYFTFLIGNVFAIGLIARHAW